MPLGDGQVVDRQVSGGGDVEDAVGVVAADGNGLARTFDRRGDGNLGQGGAGDRYRPANRKIDGRSAACCGDRFTQ